MWRIAVHGMLENVTSQQYGFWNSILIVKNEMSLQLWCFMSKYISQVIWCFINLLCFKGYSNLYNKYKIRIMNKFVWINKTKSLLRYMITRNTLYKFITYNILINLRNIFNISKDIISLEAIEILLKARQYCKCKLQMMAAPFEHPNKILMIFSIHWLFKVQKHKKAFKKGMLIWTTILWKTLVI